MIECYIDGRVAYPDTSQKIKVTYSNQYVEDSGSYTYQVTFPMAVRENKLVFGNVDRFDVRKSLPDYEECRLLVDNRLVISGKGTVTAITNDTVKLQIVGGKSRIKYNSLLEQHYIDEMDYDTVVITKGIDREGYGQLGLTSVTPNDSTTMLMIDLTDWNFVGKPGVCAFNPIEDESNSFTCNQIFACKFSRISVNGVGWPTGKKRVYMCNLAVQPFLMYVVKKVLEQEGYTLTQNDFDKDPWNRLVIASATRSVRIKDALPHWTAYHLLEEVRKFFNASILFDEQHKTVRIISQNEMLNSESVHYDCEDEFSVEYDEDGLSTIATTNIEYALDDSANRDWRETIIQSVKNTYETKEYDTVELLKSAAEKMTEKERKTTIFKVGYAYYIYAMLANFGDDEETETLTMVGQFSPYIHDSESEEYTDLAICPAAVYERKRWLDDEAPNWLAMFDQFGYAGTVILPSVTNDKQSSLDDMTQDDDGEYYFTVQDAMEGSSEDSTEEADEQSMPVMFQGKNVVSLDKRKTVSYDQTIDGENTQMRYPVTFTDYRWAQKWNGYDAASLSLEFTPKLHFGSFTRPGSEDSRFSDMPTIDAHNQICIKFVTDDLPDPSRIFVFRGKRYICQKIEVNVDNKGVDKEKTGYFYELLG